MSVGMDGLHVRTCDNCAGMSQVALLVHVKTHTHTHTHSHSLSLCGQTLNNDCLLSGWLNDEDCPAYVRDAYFLNR